MFQKFLSLAAIAAITVFSPAATADEAAPDSTTVAKKYTFGVSDAKFGVSDLGLPRVFRVSSDAPWKIESSAPWLKVAPASGEAGYFQVHISASPNTTSIERTGNLTIASAGRQLVTEVTQGKSGDYWKDGEVLWINKHKKGKGVSMLIVGDGFDREDLKKGGYWEKAARTLANVLTKVIVVRDLYEDYIDLGIYMGESGERGLESKDYRHNIPPRKSRFGGRNFGHADYGRIRTTLQTIPGINKDEIRFCYVANAAFGGWAYLNDNAFVSVLQVADSYWGVHEFVGHAFSGLPDLYYCGTDDAYLNAEGVDFTDDPAKVKWVKFLQRPEYVNDGVGVHKLGVSKGTTVWVAEAHRKSSMNGGTGYLTALERYQVWKRIMRIAGQDYSVEKFMEYDIPRNVGKAKENPLWATPLPPEVRRWWDDVWEKPAPKPEKK